MGLADQAATPRRSTLLDAVNVCLQVLGEQPVNTLDAGKVDEAAMAERTLLEFHREGQTRGWSWNTERGYTFPKDVAAGQIKVPANVVSFSTDSYQWDGRFQLRGQRVYDLEHHTYDLGDEIAELEADVVWLLPWDDCPEVFNRWITIRSARVLSARLLTSEEIFKYTAVDEQQALTELQRVEIDQVQANSLTDGPGLGPVRTYSPGLGLFRRGGAYLRG